MATGAAAASKSLSVINSWAVEKYARFVSEQVTNSLISQRSKAGSWKVNFRKLSTSQKLRKWLLQLFSSDSCGQIRLALLETNNLMVYSGAVIYVCDE